MKHAQEEEKNMPRGKQKFIFKLKQFLLKDRGNYIFDSIMLLNATTNTFIKSKFVALDLDIDLMKMITFDSFLGENFIRCIFRYYPALPKYVKEIFKEKYS